MNEKESIQRFYYENLLSNQNVTAKNNIVWAADFTSIQLPAEYFHNKNPKLHLFLCIDIHTNCIVTYLVSLRSMETRNIIRALASTIDKRFPLKPDTPLIIHTDRGTQFTCEKYREFTELYSDYFSPSMSRQGTPKDNAVAERFMRTFKGHRINGMTLEQAITQQLRNDPEFSHYRLVVSDYIKSINQQPNKKTKVLSPETKDLSVNLATKFMTEPIHVKAFSDYFGRDFRIEEIQKYKDETEKVIRVLAEMAARKAEVVQKTPFDFDENTLSQKFDEQIEQIRALVLLNPELIKKTVEEIIEPLEYTLERMEKKIDLIVPKIKREREIQKLRDPITSQLFPIFVTNAGVSFKKQWELKNAQLRICYTVLFHLGTRVNEIRNLTYQDIKDALITSQFNLIHFKTRQPYIHVLSKRALEDLKSLELDYEIVFNKYDYKYLFGKKKPMTEKALIKMVNKDLKRICEVTNLPYNIKSHSFRVNVISTLLQLTNVQNVANIIGHNDIRSTMKYRRYSLSKEEIQKLMDEVSKPK